MKYTDYIKQFDFSPNIKEIAEISYKAGYEEAKRERFNENKIIKQQLKRIEELEKKNRDLRQCLTQSDFYL